MSEWRPSPDLAEQMKECGYLGPVVADSFLECISEWAMRYSIDNEAEEAGVLRGPVASVREFMQAALLQCRDQGLDVDPYVAEES